jgi:hypothetical protein
MLERRAVCESSRDRLQQFHRVHRLLQNFKVISVAFCFLDKIEAGAQTGEKHNFATGALLADQDRQIKSVDSRHENVTDQQIGCAGCARFQCASSIVVSNGVIPRIAKNDRERIGDTGLVVDDHDPSAFRVAHCGLISWWAPTPQFPAVERARLF